MRLQNLKPQEIKQLNKEELEEVCGEIRNVIYDSVMKCGGHLASNLGAVESTVALFSVFDFPTDKIIFDVGHQCYPYKILSGRLDGFSALRKEGGLSGFPKRTESVYDCYDTGHAGTSVSAALGIAKARDLSGENYNVIAYIGDGSFNNGLVYEALTSLKVMKTNILIILNDNGMSISPTVGGMHEILEDLNGNNFDSKGVSLLEEFGLTYLGVKDGNNCVEMISALTEAKSLLKDGSVLLHISTKKGKGYQFSEDDPTSTHGVSSVGAKNEKEYSAVLGETLCELAKENDKISVVCAAMLESLGLKNFFNQYPERAFDVGICEENATVLCAAMGTAGLKPYYAIYSTFLQRSFDEIIHDVCAQDSPVTFCIDRAGISGADGETHQGVFDLSYLSLIPNLSIAVPKDLNEFKRMIVFSSQYNHPLAIRYPRSGSASFKGDCEEIEIGRWEYINRGEDNIAILASGERCMAIAMEICEKLKKANHSIDVINARFVKPIDEKMLRSLNKKNIITIEDNVAIGGFGSAVNNFVMQNSLDCKVKNFAYRDEFIHHGAVPSLQKKFGVDKEEIELYILECLQ